MELREPELTALQASGVASPSLINWVRSKQQQLRQAEEKFADAEGASGLFERSSDSSSEEEDGYELPIAQWKAPNADIEVWYALARGAAFGHGDEVWAAAVYVSEQLCNEARRRELLPAPTSTPAPAHAALSGYRIVELGAGCAIPSWVGSCLGASVAASDYPSLPTITAMLRAALLNGHGTDGLGSAAEAPRLQKGRVEVVGHEWGTAVSPLLNALGAAEGGQRYDVAIVCDCIYDPSGHDPLLRTVCDTLRPGGVALVAFSLHGNVKDESVWAFFSRAADCGLKIEHVAEEDMHPDLVGHTSPVQQNRSDDVAMAERDKLGTSTAGRECLNRRRGAKRNKVYMSRMLVPEGTPAQFRAAEAVQVPVPTSLEPSADGDTAEPDAAQRGSCILDGVGPMQHGVGLVGDSAEDVEKLAAVSVKQVPGRGRCVFASEPIRRGELVEISPCLRFPRAQYEALHLAQTVLEHYVFVERGTRDLLLALGIGSLFNHSENPNVDYRVDPPVDPGSSETVQNLHADPQGRVTFRCARPVAAGEELCIFYGPDLWFKENQQVEITW